jgi:hypothetical protein
MKGRDLRRVLDVEPPDLWPEIERRVRSQAAGRGPTAVPEEPHHPKRMLAAVFAFVVAVAGIAVLVRAFVIHPRNVAPLSTSASSSGPSASPSPAPVLGGSGLVIAYSDDDVRFCNGPIPADLSSRPPTCGPQIRVEGVDLSALSNEFTRRGVTLGTAYLAGPLSDGTLRVIEQGPPRYADSGPGPWIDPPCSPPANGWATAGPVNPVTGSADEPSTAALDGYQKRFPSEVVSVTMFQPNPQTWVVTIASTDPAHTTDALAPDYPDQLCVVRSNYELSDIQNIEAKATALLVQHWAHGVTGVGLTTRADGQPAVQIDVVSDTPEVRDALALASQPAGLVEIVPWLKPASG